MANVEDGRILFCRRIGSDCNHVSEVHVVRPIYMIVASYGYKCAVRLDLTVFMLVGYIL